MAQRYVFIYHSRAPVLNAAPRESDAHLLNRLESWEASKDSPNTTSYLSRIHKFQKHNTTGTYKIATSAGSNESGAGRSLKKPIASEFTSKITKAFLDSLYSILDGFIPLAMEQPADDDGLLARRQVNGMGAGSTWNLKDGVSRRKPAIFAIPN